MSKAVKDILIKRTAEELKLPEIWVERVVSHQFKSANKAALVHGQIEISGFGTFQISKTKLQRKLNKLLEIKEALEKKLPSKDDSLLKKLEALEHEIQFLNKKLGAHQLQTHISGVEEQDIHSGRS